MSREIRFRAWDKNGKQFADYEDIEECLSCQNRDGWKSSDGMGCCFGINSVEVLADCIIEQYTGLKDKNGKEIYEGDIVKQLMYVFEGKEHITTWVVRWNKENCCFELHYLSGNLFGDSMMADDEEYKVIGNIHENPELIGGEE